MATREDLTVALAQNRQGRVLVANDLILEAVRLLFEHMMVCSKAYDEANDTWTFLGYAPGFEALELGASPPVYSADVTAQDGAPVTLTFRKLC
jgi:hypothetical protein